MMMSWKFIKSAISATLFGVVFYGCMQSDYTRLVKTELGKGIRQDSILFGINFGDTRGDFFGKCFDLNKKQLISQGPNSQSVQYIFTDSLVHHEPIQLRLLFYPTFDKDEKISDMELEFSYMGWAPWNRSLQSDSLEVKVMELLKQWYKGNEFVSAKANNIKFPVKLDGNRRILVYVLDPQSVGVRIQDILHPKFKHSISHSRGKKSNEKQD
jgi:hypothetical protein